MATAFLEEVKASTPDILYVYTSVHLISKPISV